MNTRREQSIEGLVWSIFSVLRNDSLRACAIYTWVARKICAFSAGMDGCQIALTNFTPRQSENLTVPVDQYYSGIYNY